MHTGNAFCKACERNYRIAYLLTMILKYVLFETDFLENQLYFATKGGFIKQMKAKAINGFVLASVIITIWFIVNINL